ncbi:MAG TPA: HD domain-containing protein [Streptosporangiaceae bacterium]|nr:HD domain-containing protein [Streptosporangiaceae bacterium]
MSTNARRLLAAMPLHAITATYGEEGLRERFAAEIAPFPDPDRRRLEEALALAARLHAADRREGEPYVNHLLRVAIRIICYYGVTDTDVVCAALLHDAVEDHAGELAAAGGQQAGSQQADGSQAGGRQAALAVLAARYGERVAELVAAVTNPEYAPGRDTREQYREHVAASLENCPWARVIKASDFTDNGAGLIHTTGPRLGQLAAKYAPLVPVLRDLITRPDTPLDAGARERILGQLDRAAERFSAILPPSEELAVP